MERPRPPYDTPAKATTKVQAAVNAAESGSEIRLGVGAFGVVGEPVIVRRGLTIRGAGAERSAIERRGTALTRLFVVMHPNAVLQDLTLRNGDWQRAGMAYGGAVWTRGGLIERCLITNNILGGWGGAGPADGVVFDGTVSQDSCIADTVSDNLGALIMTNVYTNAVLFLTNAVDGGMGLTVAGPIEVYSGHLVFTGNTTMINGGTPSAPWGMGYALRRRACMWPPALRSMPMDVAFWPARDRGNQRTVTVAAAIHHG